MSTGFRYKDIAYMYDAIGRKPNPKDLTHTQSTLIKYMYIYGQVFYVVVLHQLLVHWSPRKLTEIFEASRIPFIWKVYSEKHQLMKNNVPKHARKVATEYLEDNGIVWWKPHDTIL